jgi:5-formyltetrahydrofolate cyclo-ligase
VGSGFLGQSLLRAQRNTTLRNARQARAKVELRKRLRGLRATTPEAACAERSGRIVARLREHATLARAGSVALFWPILERHEVDLRDLDGWLRARGVRVAYPSIDPETRVMTFRLVEREGDLVERGMGFAEPPLDAPEPDRLDAIVVPALGLELGGHRLGYGAGFYDRTLPAWAPPATTLAVAYDFQLLVEVPVTEHDVAVDWIVTDERAAAAEKAL